MRKIQNYIEKWEEKFGKEHDYDFSKLNYINKRTKICIVHKIYGEIWINPESFFKHGRTQKDYSNNRTARKYSKEDLIKSSKKLNVKIISEFKSTNDIIIIEDRYGLCKIKAISLIRNYTPCIRTAIDKNEYFKNKAREVHGNKYDYSLVDYVNSSKKIKIIGKFGVFEQTPDSHLQGNGCRKEFGEKHSETMSKIGATWSYTKWEKVGKNSKNFDSFKLYIIECWDDKERFYKIGKTFRKLDLRFHSKEKLPYAYKIISIKEFDSAKECSIYEKNLHKENKEFKYKPLNYFGGSSECFNKINKQTK